MKEGAEVVVEKVGREALEAGAKRTIAEMLEQLAKHEGDDIAKVIDGKKIMKIGPDLLKRHIINFTDEIAVSRQVNGLETFYKYHGSSNRLGRDFNYVKKRKYSSLSELKEDFALLDEWGVKVEYVTEFKPQKVIWVIKVLLQSK